MSDTCSNCGGCPAPYGGLDARCYQYKKRNGVLPTADRKTVRGRRMVDFTVRLPPELRPDMAKAATLEGCTSEGEWVRLLIRRALRGLAW